MLGEAEAEVEGPRKKWLEQPVVAAGAALEWGLGSTGVVPGYIGTTLVLQVLQMDMAVLRMGQEGRMGVLIQEHNYQEIRMD